MWWVGEQVLVPLLQWPSQLSVPCAALERCDRVGMSRGRGSASSRDWCLGGKGQSVFAKGHLDVPAWSQAWWQGYETGFEEGYDAGRDAGFWEGVEWSRWKKKKEEPLFEFQADGGEWQPYSERSQEVLRGAAEAARWTTDQKGLLNRHEFELDAGRGWLYRVELLPADPQQPGLIGYQTNVESGTKRALRVHPAPEP